MKDIMILVKREFWEQRTILLYLPLGITALCVGLLITAFIKGNFFGLEGVYEYAVFLDNVPRGSTPLLEFNEFADRSFTVREYILGHAFVVISVPLMISLFFTMVTYFVYALYQDRKDRSILFWKSMPVSDVATVISKLITGLVVAPLITFVCLLVLHLLLLLISSVFALGSSVDIWATLWQPSQLLSRSVQMFSYFVLFCIWCMPIYTWILLVSSAARSIPLAWAFGIPVTLILLEQLLFKGTAFERSGFIAEFVGRHIVPGWLLRDELITVDFSDTGILRALDKVFSLELLLSLGLSAVFVYGAVKFRERAGEI